MSNIFISYSSKDRETARQLANALQQEGWSVWWDHNIAAGKSYQRVIESELDAADCAIVIWSKNSVYSDWVVAEAEEGRTRGILVPVSIDDAKPPLVFRQIQTADLQNWNGDPSAAEFRQLADDVRPLIAASATSVPKKYKPEKTPEKPEKPETPDTTEPPEPPDGKTGRWLLLAAAALVGIAALVAWPYIQNWLKPEPTPTATILKFDADPMQIKAGESAKINWSTVNATRVTLRPADDTREETMQTSGSKMVSPNRTTEYVLTAQSKDPEQDAATALITIEVMEADIAKEPEIVVFKSDKTIILAGGGKYLDDSRVIKAIFYGVPLKGLAERRIGKVRTFFEFPLGKNRKEAIKGNYKIKRSRKLMADAGLAKGLGGYLFYGRELSNLAQDVQNYLKRMGFVVSLKSTDSSDARSAAESNIAKTGRPTLLLELK